ncbi:hypothetical protein [Microcella humidisoli]|uniref:Uncharacterized protein n=1 Tax=Microcella humidisoli TaxID=2963406 RepID=A0ABY5FVV0_9MICO|nr:hypothetical protein [Microcella humidisoli]UTT62439.1 hypothetical protein NNL39_12410 [Microcella humidisoli]
MIERFLDHFENMLSQQNGDMIYHLGPFSRWGSVFNAVVSGILLIAGLIGAVTSFQPFHVVFIAVAATLHTFFILVAVRVYNGRTLYDRELAAQLEAEESGAAD